MAAADPEAVAGSRDARGPQCRPVAGRGHRAKHFGSIGRGRMQTKIPGVIPAIHVFALFQPLELPVGLCPSSSVMRLVRGCVCVKM
jgi:hypothetical protein